MTTPPPENWYAFASPEETETVKKLLAEAKDLHERLAYNVAALSLYLVVFSKRVVDAELAHTKKQQNKGDPPKCLE